MRGVGWRVTGWVGGWLWVDGGCYIYIALPMVSLVGCFAGPQAILFVPRVLQAYDYYNTSKADDYEIGK